MLLDLGERIKKARKEAKLTQKELAKKAGMKSQGALSDLENGRNKSSSSLYDIAKATNVNYEWLATGEGEMKPKPSLDELKSMVADIKNKDTPKGTTKVEMTGYVPVISWVAAGAFVEVVDPATLDNINDWIPRPANTPDNVFGLKVRGRSMYPEFKPDEVIYVNPNVSPLDLKDGDLIVIQLAEGGEATFKQLIIGDTSEDMYLKPLNPDWHEQTIIPLEKCQLVGKVFAKYVTY